MIIGGTGMFAGALCFIALRWLHDDAIAQGVIDAMQTNAACHMAGVVEPWHASP
jgi:hypothetical protein